MLKADLTRAGIEPVDALGRVVDMHSLRHGYITALAKAEVPIKTLQTLARHSDPKLTLNVYTHLTIHDTAAAVDHLPDLTSPRQEPEGLAATGTTTSVTPISERFAPLLPHAGEGSGWNLSEASDGNETIPVAGDCLKVSLDSDLDAAGRNLSVPDGSALRRTRTYNPPI